MHMATKRLTVPWPNAGRCRKKGKKTPTDEKQIVNVGSKKQGTCNLNVGTTPANDKRPGLKSNDVVVATKDVINVCK